MSQESDAKLIRDNYQRYTYCRDNGHLDFIRKANECDDYFAGIQWDPIVRKRLERSGKPVLTINKILPTTAAVMGEQLKNRADISFKPLKNGTQDTASVLNKVYIQISNNNKLDWIEANVADDGFITSRGFYDVRVVFGDSMQGEVRIKNMNPRNVAIDPDAEDYDPDTWKDVTITKWLTLDDITLLYGKSKSNDVKKGGSSLPYDYDMVERTNQSFGGFVLPPQTGNYDDDNTARKYRIIERQYKKIRYANHFADPATGDVRLIPENWTSRKATLAAKKAGIEIIRRKVEQIRWTVTCHNTVLHDAWSPYKHFTIVPYFPFFRYGTTIGIAENLLSSQELLNKTSSQELHIVNTTANSGWKVKSGSLQNMTIEELEDRGAETGLVMEMDDPDNAQKITPNNVPQGLDRVSFKADEHIKEISGVSDSARGFDRADVAAKAIKAKQAAGSVNLAKPLDNLARTRHLLAIRVLDLVQTFYSEERILQITGNTPDAQTEEVKINERTPEGEVINDLTIGEYEVVVTTAPAKNNFQETQFQEATQLRELGVNIPDSILIQNSSLENKQEIIDSQQGTPEQQDMERQKAELEMQQKRVELAEKETKAILNRANAMLAMKRSENVQADTMQTMQEIQNPQSDMGEASQMGQLALSAQQAQSKDSLEREKFEFDKQLKIAERRDKIREGLEAKYQAQKEPKQQETVNG